MTYSYFDLSDEERMTVEQVVCSTEPYSGFARSEAEDSWYEREIRLASLRDREDLHQKRLAALEEALRTLACGHRA